MEHAAPPAKSIRIATIADLPEIGRIYNEGIADRIATLDEDPKDDADMAAWWALHRERYAVLVAEDASGIAGWASLNPYSHRCAYRGVADLSIYVARASRGTGIGSLLLGAVERTAREHAFHKIVLFALAHNVAGHALYRKFSYREVGLFKEQGTLDGAFVDVLAMEKILAS
jgi:phosphinothricin acetyltransferase